MIPVSPQSRRLAVVAIGLLAASPAPAAADPTKPNIVVILADNFGYGELGAYGGRELREAPTPRLDALAGEGLRLTNFNVEAQCTPSRSALLTGRDAIRSGTSSVPLGGQPDGLMQRDVTTAELLSEAGYATGQLPRRAHSRHPPRVGFGWKAATTAVRPIGNAASFRNSASADHLGPDY